MWEPLGKYVERGSVVPMPAIALSCNCCCAVTVFFFPHVFDTDDAGWRLDVETPVGTVIDLCPDCASGRAS